MASHDLEHTAFERLRMASDMSIRLYKKPLLLCYSGGKDSDVLLHLAESSGIPFEVVYCLTTADAPQTVKHVQETFRRLENNGIKCTIDKHIQSDGSRITMWNLIPRKLMPPTRVVRYCCDVLKETTGKDRFISTGVRWAESIARKKSRGSLEVQASKRDRSLILVNDNDEDRRLFETCQLKGKRVVNPIIDWLDSDVYDYAESSHISLNPLYSCGFNRTACIGCPMASTKGRYFEFSFFPSFQSAYIRAFDRMLVMRRLSGKPFWYGLPFADGHDVFHWWMQDGVLPGQLSFDDDI